MNTIMKDDETLTKWAKEEFPDININVTNGHEKLISQTNLKEVCPIIYQIKDLVILYFRCDEIKDKKYFITKEKREFNLSELKSYLRGVL